MTGARVSLRDRLSAGSTRDLGPTNEVAREALHNPKLVRELIDALDDERSIRASMILN